MNDPALPGPEGMRPEWLAAYADGELDAATQAAIERWLQKHPHALKELLTQRQFSPANWPLWRDAEPPRPDEAAWNRVGCRIHDAVLHPHRALATSSSRRWAGLGLSAGLAAAAAIGFIAWTLSQFIAPPQTAPAAQPRHERVQVNPLPAPWAEDELLPIATRADVEIQRLAALDHSAILVGEMPIEGPLVLATEDDVAVEGIEEHPHWPSGGPIVVPNPGDAPMIYVSRPR